MCVFREAKWQFVCGKRLLKDKVEVGVVAHTCNPSTGVGSTRLAMSQPPSPPTKQRQHNRINWTVVEARSLIRSPREVSEVFLKKGLTPATAEI